MLGWVGLLAAIEGTNAMARNGFREGSGNYCPGPSLVLSWSCPGAVPGQGLGQGFLDKESDQVSDKAPDKGSTSRQFYFL